ncbi:MFS transporter [Herbaspirillum sp. SJZ099]|uniref:MFS transporter n=1 Tax=Herbaspirillum sp. SJZ099 TaxID=2572916 RepID=UPI0011A353FF|nr:MFS transporter [Herbaspirillum sp. SJZ099]TWC71411.1 sugar phosphate permease [Herbaspirillum sp. SJZ099]
MKYPYRWNVAALLFFAGMLNYLDRAALAVAAPLLKTELQLDAAQMGILFSSFFVGYAGFCFIGGYASDRFGPKRVFTFAAGFWSLFCGATAVVTSFAQLIVFRIFFGIGEGPMGSTTNKTINNWFPRKEAGTVVGITNAGQPLGGALAAPVVGLISLAFGWRVSFVVIALLGLAWLLAWQLIFRDDPLQHPKVGASEREVIAESRKFVATTSDTNDRGMLHYIKSPQVLAIAMAFFCYNYVLYFFLSWFPSYLTDYQHLPVKEMSIIGIIPWLGGAIGMILGGVISDRIFRRTKNGLFARKSVLIAALGIAALCVVLSTQTTSMAAAVALIAVANLFLLMAPQACWVLIQEIVPPSRVGGTGGFVHLLANLSGIVGPALTGFIIQYGGGYHAAFLLAGGIAALGMLVVIVVIRNRATPAPAVLTA